VNKRRSTDDPQRDARLKLLAISNVQAALNASVDFAVDALREQISQEIFCFVLEHPIESPIEAIFLTWWLAIARTRFDSHHVEHEIGLWPQISVEANGEAYRFDFTVGLNDPDLMLEAESVGVTFPNIGIELDGHEWHERTKEQVTDRNQRDRNLQMADYKVFHFSGSELVADPVQCVTEVLEFAFDALCAFKREMWKRKRSRSTPPQQS
jgi:hypothetical protein